MISWASNPVRGVSHSWVGSTPAAFRQNTGSQEPPKAPALHHWGFFILRALCQSVFADHSGTASRITDAKLLNIRQTCLPDELAKRNYLSHELDASRQPPKWSASEQDTAPNVRP